MTQMHTIKVCNPVSIGLTYDMNLNIMCFFKEWLDVFLLNNKLRVLISTPSD